MLTGAITSSTERIYKVERMNKTRKTNGMDRTDEVENERGWMDQQNLKNERDQMSAEDQQLIVIYLHQCAFCILRGWCCRARDWQILSCGARLSMVRNWIFTDKVECISKWHANWFVLLYFSQFFFQVSLSIIIRYLFALSLDISLHYLQVSLSPVFRYLSSFGEVARVWTRLAAANVLVLRQSFADILIQCVTNSRSEIVVYKTSHFLDSKSSVDLFVKKHT